MSHTLEALAVFATPLPSPAALRRVLRRPPLFDGHACAVDLEPYLADPNQPLTPAERTHATTARQAIRIVAPSNRRAVKLTYLVEIAAAALQLGACAFLLPAAMRVVGAAHLHQVLAEPALHARWLSLFVHEHAVLSDGQAWVHTHGMQYLGLPDVECLADARHAADIRLIVQAVIHRLARATAPLRLGDILEPRPRGARYALEPSLPADHFGVFGAVRLTRLHR